MSRYVVFAVSAGRLYDPASVGVECDRGGIDVRLIDRLDVVRRSVRLIERPVRSACAAGVADDIELTVNDICPCGKLRVRHHNGRPNGDPLVIVCLIGDHESNVLRVNVNAACRFCCADAGKVTAVIFGGKLAVMRTCDVDVSKIGKLAFGDIHFADLLAAYNVGNDLIVAGSKAQFKIAGLVAGDVDLFPVLVNGVDKSAGPKDVIDEHASRDSAGVIRLGAVADPFVNDVSKSRKRVDHAEVGAGDRGGSGIDYGFLYTRAGKVVVERPKNSGGTGNVRRSHGSAGHGNVVASAKSAAPDFTSGSEYVNAAAVAAVVRLAVAEASVVIGGADDDDSIDDVGILDHRENTVVVGEVRNRRADNRVIGGDPILVFNADPGPVNELEVIVLAVTGGIRDNEIVAEVKQSLIEIADFIRVRLSVIAHTVDIAGDLEAVSGAETEGCVYDLYVANDKLRESGLVLEFGVISRKGYAVYVV